MICVIASALMSWPGSAGPAGKLAAPVEPFVLGSQRQPAGLAQRGRGLVFAVCMCA